MKLSRRRFLRNAAGTGFLAAMGPSRLFGGHSVSTALRNHLDGQRRLGSGNPLRIPAAFTGGGIVASVHEQSVWPGDATQVWTLGGSYPAPTIRIRSGDTFSTQLTNQLAESTNIHWHGLVIPANMDGYPSNVATPDGTIDYSFAVQQRAGTYWYHPHPDMRTGPQVYKGMAGLFIVEDDAEQSLGLPNGEYDVPMVIQDRREDASHAFTYELADIDHQEGYLGDVILVNGTPEPYLEVAAGLYRFRLLNGSNARVLDIALEDGSPVLVIGTDGGLLDQPYEVGYVYLAPAERIELLIDFSRYAVGKSVMLKSLPFSGGTGRVQGVEMPMLRFDIVRPAQTQWHVPTTLVPYERLDAATASRERKFTLKIDHASTPVGHTINDKMFDMMRIDEQVKSGDVEIWTFENISFLHHPMHMHGVQFQVVSRSSTQQLQPRDFGWKDTVYVRPFETVKVVVRFPQSPGVFLVHCHNLEHEDHGMMLNFEIVDGNSGVDAQPGISPDRMDLR